MGSLIVLIVILIWLMVRVKKTKGSSDMRDRMKPAAGKSPVRKNRPARPARAQDGHVLKGIRDITCRQFGHDHDVGEEPLSRFIVHDDPEDGYILLNGVKMLLSEADEYENRI